MGDSFSTRIQKDLEKYSGKRQTVRTSIIDVMTMRHLSPDQMHVNPEDDFVNPKVGLTQVRVVVVNPGMEDMADFV
ncbi:MAG: hypothetical protein J6E40_13315 [Lachnospiraceae bacterium]|nr:hypothetical protein [Lachnospiraceae bacterium]